MGTIPANATRVPTTLPASLLLSRLTNVSTSLLRVQEQLATGRLINRPSDDAISAATILEMDDRIERGERRLSNLQHADSMVALIDGAIGEASDMAVEARSLGLGQIGVNSDPDTRAAQATVITSMLDGLFGVANTRHKNLYLFGGSTPNRAPVEIINGGYRYVGEGEGLLTDGEQGVGAMFTVGGQAAIGSLSARSQSTRDLNPNIQMETALADLNGARGLGVSRGVIELQLDDLEPIRVDLSGAETIGDVVDRLNFALSEYEAELGLPIVGGGGVTLTQTGLQLDVGAIAGGSTLEIRDLDGGVTAQDLGIDMTLTGPITAGADLDPRLTLFTPVSALSGLTGTLDGIRVRFSSAAGDRVIDVDLSGATTIDEIRDAIETQARGVRVRINDEGTGLDIHNEIAGVAMSIEEIPGLTATASDLGIRTLDLETPTSIFNDGAGIEFLSGQVNPDTGLVERRFNTDLRITLGDGSSFDVDFQPGDEATLSTIIARIQNEAVDAMGAGDIPPGSFSVNLADGRNALEFRDLAGLGTISVESLNNSPAGHDLGILGGTFDAGSATFTGADPAGVVVDNLFTRLTQLRDALSDNDEAGIELAVDKLNGSVDQLAGSRAIVGARAGRIADQIRRQEQTLTFDAQIKSSLQDLDYADASFRFSQLQTSLTATLQVGALAQQQSLLSFLG